ncbi:MAG: hypothetical protein C0399_01000 [Syntrophus sp. (in: bacteria)]|nr:hypothetical protein [Syntrophus sp. (in: bacteria)]
MMAAGVSIILTLGVLNLLLILFQIGTGLRWIKAPFVWHKRSAMVLAASAVVHAVLAFLT